MDTKIQIKANRLGIFNEQVIDLFRFNSPLSSLEFLYLHKSLLGIMISFPKNDKDDYDYDIDLYESELRVFEMKFMEVLINLNKQPMFGHSSSLSDEQITEFRERLNALIEEHFGREFKLNKLLSL